MPLSHLPTELLLSAASFLDLERDINSLAQTNRLFHSLINPYLYRRNSHNSGSSALLWAARLSISQGANVEAAAQISVPEGPNDTQVLKPIDCSTPLFQAAINGHAAVVKLLLETGRVEVDAKDTIGRTPLFWAALRGHEAVVRLLLQTGRVHVDSWDRGGSTPWT
jgi:ankyrin repeat protein